jgi:hypothetical protein
MHQLLLRSILILSFSFLGACSSDCYDAQMEAAHSGICPQDCPGVCGCDGKTYCNECIANSQGIKVDKDEPCK